MENERLVLVKKITHQEWMNESERLRKLKEDEKDEKKHGRLKKITSAEYHESWKNMEPTPASDKDDDTFILEYLAKKYG